MKFKFKTSRLYCCNCSHSIDYHNPHELSLICTFQECDCKNYLDKEDLVLNEEYDTLNGPLDAV
jgi:hypothetical protein